MKFRRPALTSFCKGALRVFFSGVGSDVVRKVFFFRLSIAFAKANGFFLLGRFGC